MVTKSFFMSNQMPDRTFHVPSVTHTAQLGFKFDTPLESFHLGEAA